MTPPQARNAIKKALVGIIDPKPKKADIKAMWDHFGSKCAFCGETLDRKDRKGHADHLVPSAKRGRNHIYNRVLACSTCNGDIKLDSDWLKFLSDEKTPGTAEEKAVRRDRIEAWQKKHKAECSVCDNQIAVALIAAEDVIKAFNKACDTVRETRNS